MAKSKASHVEAITWGDIHEIVLHPSRRRQAFNKGGMLDRLRPKFQFFHDLMDFLSQTHHDLRNPHERAIKYRDGLSSVEKEILMTAGFLNEVERPWCQTVVVASNHEEHLTKWLRERPAAYADDPENAIFFLEAQLAYYKAIKEHREDDFNLFEWALRRAGCPERVKFLKRDESFTICRGTIECGMHGDLGPLGSRGGSATFAKMGLKANVGHGHWAQIMDGLYRAGASDEPDRRWRKGPQVQTISDIVTFTNGKRMVVTSWWDGRWKA